VAGTLSRPSKLPLDVQRESSVRKRYFRYDEKTDSVIEVDRAVPKFRPRYPLPIEALAVHPSRIGEAREFDRANGVSTDYADDGSPIMQDAAHYRRYRRLHGYIDRSGYER